jgi:hypothetical protein
VIDASKDVKITVDDVTVEDGQGLNGEINGLPGQTAEAAPEKAKTGSTAPGCR